MMDIQTIGGIAIKGVKLLLNIAILVLYRVGCNGGFLGVGGTWNLNEDKTPDVEIVASGIIVGFFIYTSVVLISYFFEALDGSKTVMEIIMNFIGMFMFIMVGGTALHYWIGYTGDNRYVDVSSEKTVGIVLGVLCIVEGLIYLADLVMTTMQYLKQEFYYDE
ncbi:protein snakeskin-like [Copidosoma floridanum]|uniref:protein snakeskin-like n=1 Tax=Copidosoma floridanum TaxID=29053 RepID=UPI0006C9D164|nr:protein snakeskin-like [Copidosoma floridanum]